MTDHTDRPNPWTRRGFLAAAIVVAVVAVLGVTITVLGPADDKQTAPAPPASGGQAAAPSASAARGCALPAGEQTVPQSPPADTKWELVGTMAAPTAPIRYGPGETRDGVRVCFARNPLGALYAAVNVVATTTRPELRLPLVRTLGAGEGRDAALRQLATETGEDSPQTQIQIAGFSVLTYTPDSTTVDLAIRVASPSGTGYGHAPIPLTWQNDDWRFVIPASGDLTDNLGPLPDLAGYVPWGGA